MIDKIKAMVWEFSEDAIVKNRSIPNDMNDIAIETTAASLIEHIHEEAVIGYGRSLLNLFRVNEYPVLNPSVERISNRVAVDLAKRLDIDNSSAYGVVTRIIPHIANRIRNKLQNPEDHEFDLNQLMHTFSDRGWQY